jgi:N-6 DNA Methylase/Type I restriction enzyme R protein N terminus (HSDR_N)
VTEHPTASGPSDYVLFVKGKPLGALEAKRLEVGSEGVLEQAKRYSREIAGGAGNWNGYRIPFLYSSNGHQHWFADVRREGYVSRLLPGGLHAPEALADMFGTDPTAESRFSNPVNLKKLIALIDEEEWSSLGLDVKGAAFEGLLERAASEGKKGAGQYFTPRYLIESIVHVMKPDPRGFDSFRIMDPASGTGGFLMKAPPSTSKSSRPVMAPIPTGAANAKTKGRRAAGGAST